MDGSTGQGIFFFFFFFFFSSLRSFNTTGSRSIALAMIVDSKRTLFFVDPIFETLAKGRMRMKEGIDIAGELKWEYYKGIRS
jgi:hypothetical protein